MTFVSNAVNCAQYVLDWSPDGFKGECHQKDYVVLEVEIAALEYLQKVEGWHTPQEEVDDQGHILYHISEMAIQFV